MIFLKLILETIIICLSVVGMLLLMIRNGAVAAIHFYPKKVRDRVVELGLTTPQKIRKNSIKFKAIYIPVYIVYTYVAVYVVNAATSFTSAFLQMLFIFEVFNLFDCFVIDETWVKKSKVWIIPGTEDLVSEYVPLNIQIKKRFAASILLAAIAAVLAGIFSLLQNVIS